MRHLSRDTSSWQGLALTLLGAVLGVFAGVTPARALTFEEALAIVDQQSPALQMQQAALAGAVAAQGAAASLPDPKLALGVENLPVSGMDRYSLTRDFMTMRRIALMQDMPNQAKREARTQAALARSDRERAMLSATRLQLRQQLTRSWLMLQFVARRQGVLDELVLENRRLQDSLSARIAGGGALAADMLMARQEALMLADRHDELLREQAKARAGLRRLIGERADEALLGDAPLPVVRPEQARAAVHHHAELAVYPAMLEMARSELREAQAEASGDWSWELAYAKRGAQWGDMVSFQLSFDLPWQKDRRQLPAIKAKQSEVERVEAERDELMRRHAQELDEQLAELQALDSQRARLRDAGLRLSQERVALALAAYQSGRGDLGAVLGARRELLEVRMRQVDLDAQRADLQARLNNLVAE
jgi:outer membrane protein TolC